MSLAKKIIISVIIFLLAWFACKAILKVYGHYDWEYAEFELHRFNQNILESKVEHSELQNVTKINHYLSMHWENDETVINYQDWTIDPRITSSIQMIRQSKIRIWDKAPIYILSKDLPDGFGIYLSGEDNISMSSGNDDDDINSWDRSSKDFYYERLRRSWVIRDIIISLVASISVFMMLVLDRRV